MDILELFRFGFAQRAVIVGLLIAVLCSTLGIFLVLRRLSLIGDGLAHLTFGSIAVGMFFKVYPFYMALPLTLLGGLGMMKLTEKARIYGDSAIGIISSTGIALGILITSISGGFNIDLFSYLFGNILTIKTEDILFTFILTLIVLITIYYFLDEFLSTAFDEELAKVSGINTKRLNAILIIITALTIVLSMRVVGILLVSSFLILPNVSALQIAKNFKRALIFSNLISIFCLLSGIIFSFAFNIPAGATIVLLNVIFLILTLILKKFFF